jgi:TonB family protein
MSRLFPFQSMLLILFLAALLVGSYAPASEGDDAFQMINEARATARAGRYLDALDRLEAAIRMADEGRQKLAVAIALNNIAEIYRLQRNNLQALHYNYQALKIYDEIGHQNGFATTSRLIDEILGKPQTRSEYTTVEPAEPLPSDGPADTRQRLIDEAMARVRNRVKAGQEKKEGDQPVPPQASRKLPASPQEHRLPQSAKTESAQDAKQIEYKSYLEQVKKKIVRVWKYPVEASRNRDEGKVDLEFTILKDGRLKNARILVSSGNFSMDREAIRSVRSASPFNPIPEQTGLEEISIRFTFNYTLE